MTRLINLIDPKTHPRVYWLLLILNKWGMPILKCAFLLIIVMIAARLFVDGIHLFDKETATDNELALFNMLSGAILLMVALFYKRAVL